MQLGYEDYRGFIKQLLNQIDAYFGKKTIIACALFGSVARGEAKPYSDINILIIHEKVGFDPIKRFVDALLEVRKDKEYSMLLERSIYPQPSVIFMTPQEISHRPLILLDIMDHGLILKDERGFLGDLIQKFKERLREMGAKKIIHKDDSWAWDLKPDWKPGEAIEIIL